MVTIYQEIMTQITLDLDTIKELWKEDSRIDIDNLHDESLKIPCLHAKYYEMYVNVQLLKKKAEQKKKELHLVKYEYYSGKADESIYRENPLPKKVRDKEHLTSRLGADDELSKINLKIEYYDTMLHYIDSILKMISNRTYQIKNSIDFLRFQSGLG